MEPEKLQELEMQEEFVQASLREEFSTLAQVKANSFHLGLAGAIHTDFRKDKDTPAEDTVFLLFDHKDISPLMWFALQFVFCLTTRTFPSHVVRFFV